MVSCSVPMARLLRNALCLNPNSVPMARLLRNALCLNPNSVALARLLRNALCPNPNAVFFDAIASQRISSFRNANSHKKTFCESVWHLFVKIGKNPIYLMRLISILLQRLLAEWTLCRFASFAFCLPFAFQAASSFGLYRLHNILR